MDLLDKLNSADYRTKLMKDAQNLLSNPDLSKYFNMKHDVLPVKNGIVDLRTGELRPRTQEDMFTQCLDIDFNVASSNPNWETFINQIMLEAPETIKFMQVLFGYSITGYTTCPITPK